MRTPLVPHALGLLHAGLPGLVFREKDLEEGVFTDMARRLRTKAEEVGALLLVTNRLEVAVRIGAHGVHLGGDGPSLSEARCAFGAEALLGASLHRGDDPHDPVWQEADYFFYSPIFTSVSKPGVPPLGIEALADFCRRAARPVFALGGVTPETMRACHAAGAHGAAVVGSLASQDAAATQLPDWAPVGGEPSPV